MSDNFETTRLPNFKNFQSYFYLFLKFLLTSCLFERLPFSQCSCSKKSMTSNDVNQNLSSVTTLIDTRAMTQFDELFKGAIISLLQGTDHRLNELLQPKKYRSFQVYGIPDFLGWPLFTKIVTQEYTTKILTSFTHLFLFFD